MRAIISRKKKRPKYLRGEIYKTKGNDEQEGESNPKHAGDLDPMQRSTRDKNGGINTSQTKWQAEARCEQKKLE